MSLSPLQDPLLHSVPTVDGYKVLEPAVLVEKLPEGGMAAVYRGLHLDLKVDVAVKVLKRSGEAGGYSPQAVARFRQEAEQAARLNDPNLVRIYDFPATKIGLLYLVMEYVDGETIESRVHRKGRLTPHETVTIAYHSARGLHAAHAENVIHRDIKPPNILISKRGHVKLTDLGIAKAQDSAAMGMTQEVTLLGTPQYMAPELWRGARFASPASDVFALGATIAFMLTGRHVLDGADTQEIMHRILSQGFPDLSGVVPNAPPKLLEVINLCTKQQPNDRISIEELILLLRELLDLHHGEYPLADPAAGTTLQPLHNARLPSRSDLARIREQLDEVRARIATPIPGTMRVRDDPATVVAEAVAAGRVDLYGLASTPPTRAFVRPSMRKQKGGLARALTILLVLGAIGGGGWVAVQQGWFASADPSKTTGGGPASQPATRADGTLPAVVIPPVNPRTQIVTTQPTDPSTTRPIVAVDPHKNDPIKVGPTTKNTAVELPRLTAYEQARKSITDAAAAKNWQDVLRLMHTAWNAAEAESKRQDFTTIADQVMMTFRAENRDLAQRRTAFPELSRQIVYIADDGRSGAAALVMAESSLLIEGKGASRRLRSTDAENGFAGAIKYLDRAKAGQHKDAASDADTYLLDARLAQVQFLGGKQRWKELVDSLEELPVAAMRQTAASDPVIAGTLARCIDAASPQLMALWQANPEPAKVQAISAEMDRPLSPYSESGLTVASLLIAESLITYDQKGNLTGTKEGAVERAVAMLEKARAGRDAKIAGAATGYLLDAYAGSAQSAASRQAWGEVISILSRGQALVAAGGAATPQQQALVAKWRAMADHAVSGLRGANPDLDKRREAFPTLAKDLQPLADAGVFAARLAMAEQSIGYEADPLRATPRGGDTEFVSTLKHLAACISSPDCPADLKQEALRLEWDVFASFVYRASEARPADPKKIAEELKRLARCGGSATRQVEYAALVDHVLKPDNSERVNLRLTLAEGQLGVQEDPRTGMRALTQRDAAVLAGISAMLKGARESGPGPARERAAALMGEIAMLDPSPKSRADAYASFKDALTKKSSPKGDPVALMGMAAFYQLPDDALAAAAGENPAVNDVTKLDAKGRQNAIMGMYREAAFSGDVFALYLAGQYTWQTFEHTPDRKTLAESYLKTAVEKGHKKAVQALQQVRAGR
jgi:serine/threonine protein kinase